MAKEKTLKQPHIGALLKTRIKERGFSDRQVADGLNRTTSTINAYYDYETVQALTLWKIGETINYNILAELGELHSVPYAYTELEKMKAALEKTIETQQTQLSQQRQQISDLEKELAIYKRIVHKE